MAPPQDEEFDWEMYMGDKPYNPAPPEAFYQNPELLENPDLNKFEEGKFVAIQDPRVPDSKCLGRIITVDKIWLCIKIEGEKFAEYWLNCDDETLYPLSEAMKDGGQLTPPKNFDGNQEKYNEFVNQKLAHDDDEEDPRAPEEWFMRISPELKPKENLFKPGMKLEVPDLKRFKDELYPSNVRSVNGNIVTIGFDGWGKKFDMTDTNECRFFYPCGTAKKIGARLIPPPGHEKAKALKTAVTPKTPKTKTPKGKANGTADAPSTARKPATMHSAKKGTKRAASETSEPEEKKPKTEESTSRYVGLFEALQKTSSSAKKTTPKSAKKATPRTASASKPVKAKVEELTPGSSTEIVLLPGRDVKPADLVFQFFVNQTCYRPDLAHKEKLARLQTKFGPDNIHHIMREFLQQVVDVSAQPKEILKAITTKSPNILGIYAVIDELEHVKFLPVARNIDHAWSIMTELLTKLNFCKNFISRTPKACANCPRNIDHNWNRQDNHTTTPATKKTKPSSAVTPIKQENEASTSQVVLPKSIKEWNVNQLCSQIAKLVPYSVVQTFREHEIDGKAAVLLDEDTLITMLRIPPNYATKLMAFIDRESEDV